MKNFSKLTVKSTILNDVKNAIEEKDKAISLLDEESQMIKLEIQSAISALNVALRTRETWLMTQVDIITNSLQSSLRKKRDTMHEINGHVNHRQANIIDFTVARNMLKACRKSSGGDISLKLLGNLEELRLDILNFGRIVEERSLANCLTKPQQLDFKEENWLENVAPNNPTSCDYSLVLSSPDVKQSSPVDQEVAKTTQSSESNMIGSGDPVCSSVAECVMRIKESPAHMWVAKSTDPCSDCTEQALTWEPFKFNLQSFQADITPKYTTVCCDSSLVSSSCDVEMNFPMDQSVAKSPLSDEFNTERRSSIDDYVTKVKDSPSRMWIDESRYVFSDSVVKTSTWEPFKFSMGSFRTEGSTNENVTPYCSFEPFRFCYEKLLQPDSQAPGLCAVKSLDSLGVPERGADPLDGFLAKFREILSTPNDMWLSR